MQDDLIVDDRVKRNTLGAVLRWLAFAGGLLGVAVVINMNPVMSAKWVTLVGTPGNPASDFVELETDASVPPARDRVVRLRINHAVEVKSVTGVAYRSFDGTARIDCHKRQARYTKGTYYKQPNFKGAPVAEKSFAGRDQPAVELRGFNAGYTRKVVELGCG